MAKWTIDWDSKKKDIKKKEKEISGGYEKDQRFWSPPKDKSGNYNSATRIRFLPDTTMEPYVKVYHHSFKYMQDGVQKNYFKNCISTFGWEPKCFVCDKNGPYYKSDFKKDKEIAAARGRKLNYISNILIVNNPENPEENGKVFLFKYGKQIYTKIEDRMFPKEENIKKAESLGETYIILEPFDLYDKGADFKLVVKPQGSGEEVYPNYEESSFYDATPIQKSVEKGKFVPYTDEEIDAIMNQTVLLSEFLAPELYPTNEEVEKLVGHLWGSSYVEPAPADTPSAPEPNDDIPFFSAPTPTAPEIPAWEDVPAPDGDDPLSDDDDKFFEQFSKKP